MTASFGGTTRCCAGVAAVEVDHHVLDVGCGTRQTTRQGRAGSPRCHTVRMSDELVFKPPCVLCGQAAVHVELVPPGQEPVDWSSMSAEERGRFQTWRDGYPQRWLLLYANVGTEGMDCSPFVDEPARARILEGFTDPHRFVESSEAGVDLGRGMCGACGAFYCTDYWRKSIGYAHCPHGHFHSLDAYYRD